MNSNQYFKERKSEFQRLARKFEGRFREISYLRIVVVIALLVVIIYLANQRMAVELGISVLVSPVIFGMVVRYHNRIRFKRDKARAVVKVNEEELQRVELELGGFDQGDEFVDDNHPFTSDLDIFGKHSLFQLLNRTRTALGRSRLAAWMQAPALREEIERRQTAVEELSGDPDWLQNFVAEGTIAGDHQKDAESLLTWLEQDDRIRSFQKPLLSMLFVLNMLVFIGMVAFDVFSWGFLIIPIAINLGMLSLIFRKVKEIGELTYEGSKALKGYRTLIHIVEETTFQSPLLSEIKDGFTIGEQTGSGVMKSLDKYLDLLSSRTNSFYSIFNLVFMVDYFLFYALHRWKNKHGGHMRKWFNSLAEMEALVSMGSFQHSTSCHMASISKKDYVFSAKEIGHPLIPIQSRVCNDVILEGKGKVVVITGSNMSGKSTFLRTVGVNMVLAYMGAPVCARELELSLFGLFTSMRTSDRLEESISSFYAELKRLQALISTIDEGTRTTMYMIDEVLKGTNSSDRHLGAKSLITQLSATSSMGWVSTHDLALGELAESNDHVVNMSFNSSLVDDQLSFDYKISKGVCHTFNASILMRQMGINLLKE